MWRLSIIAIFAAGLRFPETSYVISLTAAKDQIAAGVVRATPPAVETVATASVPRPPTAAVKLKTVPMALQSPVIPVPA